MQHNFEMQGSLLSVGNTLSRATRTDCQTDVTENELNCFVHSFISNYLISDSRLQQFQDKNQKGRHNKKTVIKFIQGGWLSEPSKLAPNLRLYFTDCEDLCYINGLVLKGNSIVIQKALQNEMKTLLHNGHFGIVKIKNRTSTIMFCPRTNNGLENIVRTYNIINHRGEKHSYLKIYLTFPGLK